MKASQSQTRSLLHDNVAGVAAIVIWFIGFIGISVFIPNELPPYASELLEIISSVVKSIEGYALLSNFPDKTRLVLCLVWIAIPIICAYCYGPTLTMVNKEWLTMYKLPALVIILAIVGTAVLFATNTPAVDDLSDRDLMGRMLRLMSYSKVGLGLMSASLSFGLGFGLAAAGAIAKTLFGLLITKIEKRSGR